MKHECSYVRDVLPLYGENMVSGETADFVKEHLTACPDCAKEWESLQAGTSVEAISVGENKQLEAEMLRTMKTIRKRFYKKACRVAAVMAAIFLLICTLLHFFPVYRIVEIGPMTLGNYYTGDQIAKALYIGSAADRREAQAVLRLADEAFNDTRHTGDENEAAYGLLKRYATATDVYGDVSFNEHSLELWSAHLGEKEGWIWVCYSSETFRHDGTTACGSWNIPALWRVEKTNSGEWVVVQIREHP